LHLHLVPKPRMMELYLHSLIRLYDIVLSHAHGPSYF
jgi:hypothetical protein